MEGTKERVEGIIRERAASDSIISAFAAVSSGCAGIETAYLSYVVLGDSIYSGWGGGEDTNCGSVGNAEHSVRRLVLKPFKFQGFQALWTAKNTQKTFKKCLAFHMQYVYNSKAC